METKRALAAAIVVAAVVGGIAWVGRETRVQECRRAAVSASQADLSFGDPAIDQGLAVARQMDREKAAECYRVGLLATPVG